MPQPRDSQRSKLYAAEDAAFDLGYNGFQSRDTLSLQECQAIVDKVWASKIIRRKYSRATRYSLAPLVCDGRGRRRACYSPGRHVIKLPRWSRQKYIVLHEIAHALAYASDRAFHGWEFCECYLHLVRVFVNRGAEDKLKQEFKTRRVRFKPKRTRTMTAEQRQVTGERLKKAREAKAKKALAAVENFC